MTEGTLDIISYLTETNAEKEVKLIYILNKIKDSFLSTNEYTDTYFNHSNV